MLIGEVALTGNPRLATCAKFLIIELVGRQRNNQQWPYQAQKQNILPCDDGELLWLRNLLTDLGIICEEPIKIFDDNQSIIHLLQRWEHKRLKHIDIKYNFIRDLKENNIIDVIYLNTKKQIADILTKSLPYEQFSKLRISLGSNL